MLAERISKDYVQAMKDRDSVRSSTLSLLRSQIKYLLIEKKTETLPDADVISVIKKQIKQRQDSIEQYEKGGRADLAGKEKLELAILMPYLPQEMSEAELLPIIQAAVQGLKAAGMKDMGAVMKEVGAKVAGRADNRMVSELVKKTLARM